jgi:hypothetical protein
MSTPFLVTTLVASVIAHTAESFAVMVVVEA